MAAKIAKGLVCPKCGEIDNYKTSPGAGKGRNEWLRHKVCQVCGCVFKTLEVVVCIVPPKEPTS